MYISVSESWLVTIKTEHEFRTHAVEGFFEDNLRLYVDDNLVAHAKINLFAMKGYEVFDVDGRTLELRWLWSWLAGSPVSIVIMHKGRILAQFGSNKAADDALIESDESHDG
jgi:hypothetical protein